MNSRGTISLLVLVLILISFLFVMNLENISKMEYILTYNSHKSEELYYIARSYNNIILYNFCYRKLLLDTISDELYKKPISLSERNFKLKNIDLEIYSDIDDLDIGGNYFVENDRLWINLYSRVKKGNIERESIFSGFLINELFEPDRYISYEKEQTYIDSLENEFNEDCFLELDIVRQEFNYRLDLNLDMINNRNMHVYNIEDKIDLNLMTNKIILKLMEEGSNLYINNGKAEYLEGIIYINGDLHIEDDVRFRGILIVTGDIYVNGNKLYINGKKFFKNDLSSDDIEYVYTRSYVYKYGIFMPDFFKCDVQMEK